MARALPRRHHILPLTKFEMNSNGNGSRDRFSLQHAETAGY
jgi:hypothetical protein